MLGLDYMASSSMNKKKITTTIPRMTGIQWVELQLQDSMECFNMFRMRRILRKMMLIQPNLAQMVVVLL
uniref:Uncharacterized protein n=1 Tax=Setaria viridis TaxID=4556 RepID=A0A4U6U2W9_SETVI|nr:hypothetical protein SEVIR_6G130200v2 [Setaria viridis]